MESGHSTLLQWSPLARAALAVVALLSPTAFAAEGPTVFQTQACITLLPANGDGVRPTSTDPSIACQDIAFAEAVFTGTTTTTVSVDTATAAASIHLRSDGSYQLTNAGVQIDMDAAVDISIGIGDALPSAEAAALDDALIALMATE